jgi:hypothetical protein
LVLALLVTGSLLARPALNQVKARNIANATITWQA